MRLLLLTRSFARKHLGIGFPGFTSEEISRIARLTIPADLVTRVDGLLEIRDAGRFTPFQPAWAAKDDSPDSIKELQEALRQEFGPSHPSP